MRTPALLTCAPAKGRKLPCAKVLRLAVPGRPEPQRSFGLGWERPGSPRDCCGFGAGRVCAPPAPPPRVAPRPAIPAREGGSSAASRRRRTRSPTGWPRGCPASPTEAGTRWRARQPRPSGSRTRFRGRTNVGPPPSRARDGVAGVRGHPPARGFREAKTHLAPKPRKRGAASRNRVSDRSRRRNGIRCFAANAGRPRWPGRTTASRAN